MDKKKGSVKKKVSGKSMEVDSMGKSCSINGCCCNLAMVKLASMAFILFLVTVWPAVGNGLLRVHWGWYLGATIIFAVLAMSKSCCKK